MSTVAAPRRRQRSVPIPTIPSQAIEGDRLYFLNQIGEDSDVAVLGDQSIQPIAHQLRMKTVIDENGKEVSKYFILLTFMESGHTAYLKPSRALIDQGVLVQQGSDYAIAVEELGYIAAADPTVAGTFITA